MKLYKMVILIIFIAIAMYYMGGKFNREVIYKQIEKQVILDNLTEKVNEMKGAVMSDLGQCESGNVADDKALITFDPHPTKKSVQVASLGRFQFKVSTVQYYYTKFYGRTITPLEAVKIALDSEKAGELASEVIFRDGATDNWYNCSKKLGLKSRLDIINSLLK